MHARVTAIYISPAATVLPHAVTVAEARAHRGLVGDRYFEGCGTFTDWEPKGPGRELTLVEGEVLAEIGLSAAESRRNVVTEGVRLNDLVGKRFRIGEVVIEGIRLCPPCTHLDQVTGKSLLKPLAERGGLRADILSDGMIRVGDAITSLLLVRPFRIEDEADVIALWKACGLVTPQNNPHLDIVRKMNVNPEWFLVGELDGRVVASCMAGYEGHRGWINYLAVHPQHQRQGFAKQLMLHVEELLRAAGCPKINLQVRATNTAVLAFYERIGFRPDDVVSLGKRLQQDPPDA